MKSDWQLVAGQLYASLKAMPCRCQMVGKAAWHFRAQTVVAQRCSRCAAIEAYDQLAAERAAA